MIWVIGSKGMLGTELYAQLQALHLPSIGTDLDVDILNPGAMREFVQGKQIAAIVNCAAYTAVDKAEDEPEMARRLNADAVGNIAEVAAGLDVPVVHVSTDYVFPGSKAEPLVETDPTGPESVYGKTKLEGELLLKARWPKHYIVRTAWLYGKHGNNFVFTMLRLFKTRDRITVVDDQFGAPTNAADLAEAITTIVQDEDSNYGTYHFCNGGKTNWFEYANTIKRHAEEHAGVNYSCEIGPVSTEDYGARAPRPRYSLLSTEKYRQTFGKPIPEWNTSLRSFIAGIELE